MLLIGFVCHGYELKHHHTDYVFIEKHAIPAVPNNWSEIIKKNVMVVLLLNADTAHKIMQY